MNKFRSRPVIVDGVRFDSAGKHRRWLALGLLERAGHINCLQRQVVFVLAPKVSITEIGRAHV